MAKPLIVPT